MFKCFRENIKCWWNTPPPPLHPSSSLFSRPQLLGKFSRVLSNENLVEMYLLKQIKVFRQIEIKVVTKQEGINTLFNRFSPFLSFFLRTFAHFYFSIYYRIDNFFYTKLNFTSSVLSFPLVLYCLLLVMGWCSLIVCEGMMHFSYKNQRTVQSTILIMQGDSKLFINIIKNIFLFLRFVCFK